MTYLLSSTERASGTSMWSAVANEDKWETNISLPFFSYPVGVASFFLYFFIESHEHLCFSYALHFFTRKHYSLYHSFRKPQKVKYRLSVNKQLPFPSSTFHFFSRMLPLSSASIKGDKSYRLLRAAAFLPTSPHRPFGA